MSGFRTGFLFLLIRYPNPTRNDFSTVVRGPGVETERVYVKQVRHVDPRRPEVDVFTTDHSLLVLLGVIQG